MTMWLEVNGIAYRDFRSATVTVRLDALSNTFSFETTGKPFQGGETCRVIVDSVPVMTGWIERINGTYSDIDHTITVEGRDKTGDLVDSSIGTLSDINNPVSLKQVIEKVLKHIGLNISVVDNANPKRFGELDYINAPEPGDNAFSFLEPLARNRHVLLTSDGDGNIVIEKTPGIDTGAKLQNILGASDNNVKSASFSYDRTGRFNKYIFDSSLSPVAVNKAGKVNLNNIIHQRGQVTDTEIRQGRQMAVVAEASFSNVSDDDRAMWEANIRKTRARVYSAVVQGFSHAGGVWTPNQLVNVVDDFAGINAKMLINSVTYNLDDTEGGTTTISCVSKNAYSLTLDDPDAQELGDGL